MIHARTRAATTALALTAMLLAGCAAPAAEPTTAPTATTTAPTAVPAPTDTATASPDAAAGVIDTTSWVEWVSSDGYTSLRHPVEWVAETTTESAPEDFRDVNNVIDSVELTAPNGQMLVGLWDFVDVGGLCDEGSVQPVEMLALEETALPFDRAAAQAEIDEWFPGEDVEDERPVLATYALGTVDGRWNFAVGYTSAGQMERDACRVYNIAGTFAAGTAFDVTSAPNPLWTVDSLDDARAYMETTEYATILEILRSVEVTP